MVIKKAFPSLLFLFDLILSILALQRVISSTTLVDTRIITILDCCTSTTSKVCELQDIIRNKYVFRLDVSVKDAIPVHVIHRLCELIHIDLYPIFSNVMSSSADQFVDIHVH